MISTLELNTDRRQNKGRHTKYLGLSQPHSRWALSYVSTVYQSRLLPMFKNPVKYTNTMWAWWPMPVTTVLQRQRQEDHVQVHPWLHSEFKVNILATWDPKENNKNKSISTWKTIIPTTYSSTKEQPKRTTEQIVKDSQLKVHCGPKKPNFFTPFTPCWEAIVLKYCFQHGNEEMKRHLHHPRKDKPLHKPARMYSQMLT